MPQKPLLLYSCFRLRSHLQIVALIAGFCLILVCDIHFSCSITRVGSLVQNVPMNVEQILAHCVKLKMMSDPPDNFSDREESDRWEHGTNATLIRNATVWTGAGNGEEIIRGDVLFDRGVVKAVGHVPEDLLRRVGRLTVVEAHEAWVTPGLVDLHSHVGIFSWPSLSGAFDLNSVKGPILPWLRSIDSFNTHDESVRLFIAGGVTSAQVLPGSANAISGQSFMIKLRPTVERSPSSMIIEPPYTLNDTAVETHARSRRRHLKQAAGENLIGYGGRMDSTWSFRSAYEQARQIKVAQDEYCRHAEAGLWDVVQHSFPESLQWETLIDVLRGHVKIAQHVYEATDIDAMVRLGNEFRFHTASIHQAAEAYLVPGIMKRAWGGPPTVALSGSSYGYKRGSYRGSVFAPRILADNGIHVAMKTDHPALNGRYLLYEAQQAYYYGLSASLALASVTSIPASAAGLAHRIGVLCTGADADAVLWDSHPLRLGATPERVWIDGALQIPAAGDPVIIENGKKGREWSEAPEVPDWTEERKQAIEWEGLSPLEVEGATTSGRVVLRNVSEIVSVVSGEHADPHGVEVRWDPSVNGSGGTVVLESGKVICVGECAPLVNPNTVARSINLHGGCLAPALITFGSPLGLEEIHYERSTGDGLPQDTVFGASPRLLGNTILRAADALQFRTRNALRAHRAGVTVATAATHTTSGDWIFAGLSTTFRTGAKHALARGAVIQPVSALHYAVHPLNAIASALPSTGVTSPPSVSERITALRRLLLTTHVSDAGQEELGYWFSQAAEGQIPLVVDVSGSDEMMTLIALKEEVEQAKRSTMKMVFVGAEEAHLLAKEIGEERIGVILAPPRPAPTTWDRRRILPGPPLTNDTALVKLLRHGVVVGLGNIEASAAMHTRFDLAWAMAESGGRITKEEAIALASVNLEQLLGIVDVRGGNQREDNAAQRDIVAYTGGCVLDMAAKVAAVVSPARGVVDVV